MIVQLIASWVACVMVGAGAVGTAVVMRRRERHAERDQELKLACLARLDEPPADRLPSWVVLGWHGDGEDLTLATVSVSKADFRQKSWVESVGGLHLTRRECTLAAEFSSFTLLHGTRTFDDEVRELKTVWRPRQP